MSEGLANTSRQQKNYGSTTERVPNVAIAGVKFSPTELFELTDKIASNIYSINTRRKDLEQNLKTIGTPKDCQELRVKIHSKLVSANEVVDQTTKDLNKLTGIVKKKDKQQKLQVEILMNNFKDAVKLYSEIQKQVAEKMKTHLLPSEHAILDDFSQGKVTNGSQADPNLQKVMANQMEFEQGLLLEREQRIQNIESCILDINQIMNELGAMVHQQADDINSIENAIESAYGAVEDGHSELEKAAMYQTRRRKKTCILLGISVTAGIILTLIIAFSLSR